MHPATEVHFWTDCTPLDDYCFRLIAALQTLIIRQTQGEDTDPILAKMSLARIHDKHKLKKYWEEKIESHSDIMGSEESRMKSSALSKLREEWLRRLKLRNQQLELFEEKHIRRAKMSQQAFKIPSQ